MERVMNCAARSSLSAAVPSSDSFLHQRLKPGLPSALNWWTSQRACRSGTILITDRTRNRDREEPGREGLSDPYFRRCPRTSFDNLFRTERSEVILNDEDRKSTRLNSSHLG